MPAAWRRSVLPKVIEDARCKTMDATFHGTRITVIEGDITAQKVDAIVNAATSTLLCVDGPSFSRIDVDGSDSHQVSKCDLGLSSIKR